MLYGCRNAPFKGWADRITGSSEVNSGSSACELPGLEAQQSTHECKRSSFSPNSFFAGASSTLAGCVTTKPRIDVASFDQLQSRLVYRCCGDQSARQRDRRALSSPCRHEMSRYGARERRRRVRRWRNFELRALWFNLAPRRSGIGDSPRLPSFERRQPMRQSGLAIRTLKLGCLVFRLT